MHATIATLGLLASTGALAQSTSVTSWLNIAFDNAPVASIIAADANAVTYSITCAPADADDCGLLPSMTVTAGPSTLAYSYSIQTDGAASSTLDSEEADGYANYGNQFLIDCKISGTTQAACHATVSGKNAKYPTDTTTTLASEDMTFGAMTITAGLEKLAARTASATKSDGAASTKTSSGTAKATSAAKSGESSASATASPSAGGAGHFAAPLLAVAGVAAAAFAL